MSRRPSRLPSTAYFMKLDGMNWVCPMAPAQEPSIVVAVDMVLLEDLERGEQLLAEEVAPIARIGEGRQRPHHVDRAGEAAEIGLHAPDAEHDRAGHAVGALHGGERVGPLARRSAGPRSRRCAEIAPLMYSQIGRTNSDCFFVSAMIFGIRLRRPGKPRRRSPGRRRAPRASGQSAFDEAPEVALSGLLRRCRPERPAEKPAQMLNPASANTGAERCGPSTEPVGT